MDTDEIRKVQQESECLCDTDALHQALDNMAKKIEQELKESNPLVLCVMTGGIVPTGHLLTRLSFPLQLDYIHATRYSGETSGGRLSWLHEPAVSLQDRTVLIVDDIFDEGITLEAINQYCVDKGAKQVFSAVLVNKLHDRKTQYQPDYAALEIEDRYLFGFGMDYKNYLRNINAIHAVKGM